MVVSILSMHLIKIALLTISEENKREKNLAWNDYVESPHANLCRHSYL